MKVTTVTVYSDYGYVILVLCLSWILVNWLALQVSKARKRYDVKVSRDVNKTSCFQYSRRTSHFGGLTQP